jgi:uncharacterized protein (TIGR03000 family)
LTPAEQKIWADYLKELTDPKDKKAAEDEWNKAKTVADKRKLIADAKKMLDKKKPGPMPDDKPLTAAELKKWADYLKTLTDPKDKKDAEDEWKKAKSNADKRKLLKEIEDEVSAPATLIVSLPAKAKLTIQGSATTSTSSTRVFVSPTLKARKTYQYTLEARYTQDGETVVLKKNVKVFAGKTTRVSLNRTNVVVAK